MPLGKQAHGIRQDPPHLLNPISVVRDKQAYIRWIWRTGIDHWTPTTVGEVTAGYYLAVDAKNPFLNLLDEWASRMFPSISRSKADRWEGKYVSIALLNPL